MRQTTRMTVGQWKSQWREPNAETDQGNIRYAVVDLGTGNPKKITNSGKVLIDSLIRWQDGVRTSLAPPFRLAAASSLSPWGAAVGDVFGK